MNRRSFITGIIAASVAPLLLLHDDKPKWKKTSNVWIPNPAWRGAQCELEIPKFNKLTNYKVLTSNKPVSPERVALLEKMFGCRLAVIDGTNRFPLLPRQVKA